VFAAEYRWIPFFARAASRWGFVLLQRGHRDEVERVLADLVAALKAGERVSMAPEGHLSSDGKVGHFKRGAFLVAIRAGVPVVPMAVRGGHDILPPGTLRMRPGVLRYRVGKSLTTQGLSEADAPALADRARSAVAELFEALPAS